MVYFVIFISTPISGTVKLEVSITPGAGTFEVCENDALVVSGRISVPEGDVLEVPVDCGCPTSEDTITLSQEDIYKELRLRGYDYGPTFQGILSTNNTGRQQRWNYKKQCWRTPH